MYITIGVIGVPSKTTINYMSSHLSRVFVIFAGLVNWYRLYILEPHVTDTQIRPSQITIAGFVN